MDKANLVLIDGVLKVLVQINRVGAIVEQGLEDTEVRTDYRLVEDAVEVFLVCLGLDLVSCAKGGCLGMDEQQADERSLPDT